MSENYESLLEAALRLPAEEQRRLARQLLAEAGMSGSPAVRGKARRHFGAWDSGDERSADNERIDLDLAREYEGTARS
jgi:hypothetical protein